MIALSLRLFAVIWGKFRKKSSSSFVGEILRWVTFLRGIVVEIATIITFVTFVTLISITPFCSVISTIIIS